MPPDVGGLRSRSVRAGGARACAEGYEELRVRLMSNVVQ